MYVSKTGVCDSDRWSRGVYVRQVSVSKYVTVAVSNRLLNKRMYLYKIFGQ